MNDFYTLDDVKDKVIVIKYGGSIMRNERCKKSFLQDLKLLHEHGARIVIVHGGGPMISAWLDRLNMGTEFIQGLRVTDEDTMEVVEMILSGNVNKNLASEIYLSGLPAVGISGKDSGLILARKKYLIDENGDPLDIGYVGDVEEVQSELLLNLLDCGRIPVISPVGADEYGYTYNINADYVAAFISGALKADHFIILTDVDGVYKDFNDKSSLISTINVKEIKPLVINTSGFDFDIANEYLDINNTVIDLKKIIGSTNNYKAKEDKTEDNPEIDNATINSTTDYLKQQVENLRKQVEAQTDYYNSYFKTVVGSFNNLNSSLQDTNKQQYNMQVDQNTIKGSIKNYNLARWLSIGVIEASVSTIKVNYNVFDPNNEYTTIYLEVTGGNIIEPQRYYLNKESNNTTIRDLNANTNYNISLKYTVNVDGSATTMTEDVITVRTKQPNIELKITKVTSNSISYYLKTDSEYRFDKATLNVYSDNNNLASEDIDINKTDGGYNGTFKLDRIGYKNELRLENIYYNGTLTDLDVYAKFVNADE